MSVPSFWLMKSGASMPSDASAARNDSTTWRERSARLAFRIAAFSRSSSPMRPIVEDSVRCASGSSSRTMSPARTSIEPLTGENSPVTATERTPRDFMSRAASRRPFSSSASARSPVY